MAPTDTTSTILPDNSLTPNLETLVLGGDEPTETNESGETPQDAFFTDEELRLLTQEESQPNLSFLTPLLSPVLTPLLTSRGTESNIVRPRETDEEPQDTYFTNEEFSLLMEDETNPNTPLTDEGNFFSEDMVNQNDMSFFIPTPGFRFGPLQAEHCIFRKRLMKTHLDRAGLYLPKSTVDQLREHIPDFQNLAQHQAGVSLTVYDHDQQTTHMMQVVISAGRFRLIGNWIRDFVNGRSLIEGDEVGLYWDSSSNCLQFSVLSRAPRNIV